MEQEAGEGQEMQPGDGGGQALVVPRQAPKRAAQASTSSVSQAPMVSTRWSATPDRW
jgi:hypothetical protein